MLVGVVITAFGKCTGLGVGLGLALVGGCCRCRCAGPVWVLACTFVTWSSCVSDGSAKTRWWLPTAVELISGTNCVVATRRTSSTMMSMVSTYGDLWRSSGELGRPRCLLQVSERTFLWSQFGSLFLCSLPPSLFFFVWFGPTWIYMGWVALLLYLT